MGESNVSVVCLSETCAILKHVSYWHALQQNLSHRGQTTMSFKLIAFVFEAETVIKRSKSIIEFVKITQGRPNAVDCAISFHILL